GPAWLWCVDRPGGRTSVLRGGDRAGRRRLCGGGGAMRHFLFFVLTMLMPAAAPARPLYFENLTAMFGIQEGDRLHACGVCHERWKGTGPRNPFGTPAD